MCRLEKLIRFFKNHDYFMLFASFYSLKNALFESTKKVNILIIELLGQVTGKSMTCRKQKFKSL